MPPSGETVSSLLGLLYEAAASPEHWPGFFSALSESAECDEACLALIYPEDRCRFVLNRGFDPGSQHAYAEYFYCRDELLHRFIAAARIHGDWIGTSQSVMPDRDYHRSVIYNEFTRPLGLMHHCGAVLGGLDGGAEGGIGLQRAPGSGPFGREAVALLSMLAPHVKRAVNTQHTLSSVSNHNAALRQSVEALEVAVISLDSSGRVVRMSAAAQATLDLRRGIELDGGFLRAAVASEQSRLTEMVAGAVATGAGRGTEFAVQRATHSAPQAGSGAAWTPSHGGAMLISRRPPSRPLRIVVTPFQSSEVLLGDRPAALVFFSDPDARGGSRASVLCALYSLTPAECRLTGLLVEGCELAAAARQMSMATQTARFHLKSIFRKTGVGRQAELVRLVWGLPCA